MITIELSAKALAVCETHYTTPGKGNGCGKCPIQRECITQRPVRSMVELEVWRARVNEAAEKAT